MKTGIPAWAMKRANAEDYGVVQDSRSRGTMQVNWPDRKALRRWAKLQAWPTPWFGFEQAFLAKMFDSQVTFTQAIDESGIEIQFPRREYILSAERLEGLDSQYESRGASWGFLVEELREIRRAVEAGVKVQVEDGPRLQSWEGFYRWAHGRYPLLEEGYDHWIGDDHS